MKDNHVIGYDLPQPLAARPGILDEQFVKHVHVGTAMRTADAATVGPSCAAG